MTDRIPHRPDPNLAARQGRAPLAGRPIGAGLAALQIAAASVRAATQAPGRVPVERAVPGVPPATQLADAARNRGIGSFGQQFAAFDAFVTAHHKAQHAQCVPLSSTTITGAATWSL
jgi:hypothetical protein